VWIDRDDGRQLIDINGDGALDLVVGDNGVRRAYLNQKTNSDLLIRIDNGIGAQPVSPTDRPLLPKTQASHIQ